ncbi:MAG: hypothetical protein NZ772_12085 [Cyanobacteria bacterium]|nr:hypothetical protein [Cyanobacteriota bacterium]MDW8202148.1 hypothetical protein [Cyanobacteriota bacterium SKYGB_h_bin112]
MERQRWSVLLLVVLPGMAASAISAYFLFPDWAALTPSAACCQQLVALSTTTLMALEVVGAAEQRHRINCFAEGVGMLLGWTIVAIGLHGFCTLPKPSR